MKDKRIKLKLTWSKKDMDWKVDYGNGSGKILGNNLFTMIDEFTKVKRLSLRQTIDDCDYDPDSFTITVKTKESKGTVLSKEKP